MKKIINILKGLIPPKFKVGDVLNYRGQKRVSEVKFYTHEGDYFYWFEGMPNLAIAQKVLKKYEKNS